MLILYAPLCSPPPFRAPPFHRLPLTPSHWVNFYEHFGILETRPKVMAIILQCSKNRGVIAWGVNKSKRADGRLASKRERAQDCRDVSGSFRANCTVFFVDCKLVSHGELIEQWVQLGAQLCRTFAQYSNRERERYNSSQYLLMLSWKFIKRLLY